MREVGAVHASLGCGSAAAGLSCCRQPHLVLAVVVVNPQPPAETAASVAAGAEQSSEQNQALNAAT